MKAYTVTSEFLESVSKITNPWLIASDDFVVGVYNGRAAARAAKAAGLEGKIVAAREVELKVAEVELKVAEVAEEMIEAEVPEIEEEIEIAEIAEVAEEEPEPFGFETHSFTHCPSCGVHLNNGIGEHNQEVNGKRISHKKFEFCCLRCNAEFGPAIKRTIASIKPPKSTSGKRNRSSVEKPVLLCWNLFDEMQGERRKDCIAAAVAKGVTFYTAHSQYQLWFQVQKEMAIRDFENDVAKK